jgi:glycosyltransferase involved in cell wall biosynthesis
MRPASLAIVLPAYNEEARLGSALDELFGYLNRHGDMGRDGAPGAAALPANIRVLVVDDGSTDCSAVLVMTNP